MDEGAAGQTYEGCNGGMGKMKNTAFGMPYDFSKLYKRLIESYAREFEAPADTHSPESASNDTAAFPSRPEGE